MFLRVRTVIGGGSIDRDGEDNNTDDGEEFSGEHRCVKVQELEDFEMRESRGAKGVRFSRLIPSPFYTYPPRCGRNWSLQAGY